MLRLNGHTHRVRSVVYSPDGATLVSAGEDGTVRIWGLGLRTTRRATLKTGQRTIYALAISPRGQDLFSAGHDRSIRHWELPEGRPRPPLTGHNELVTCLTFDLRGRMLFSGSGNSLGQIKAWRLGSESLLTTTLEAGAWSLAMDPRGLFLAAGLAGHRGGEVRLLDPSRLETRVTRKQSKGVRALAFAPDGRTLASAVGCAITFWSVFPLGTLLRRDGSVEGHASIIHGLAFSPDGRTLASASHDGTVRFWDPAERVERNGFDWGIGPVDCVAFAPDGMTVAAGGARDVIVWDADEEML